jgi:predicted SAM-dependent methyltransferase
MLTNPSASGTGAKLKLNVGCGPVQPPGWINIDNSYRARFASSFPLLDRLLVRARVIAPTEFRPGLRGIDLERPLPWPTGSAAAVYGGEVLEHFTRDAGARLIAECFRVLAPGGVIRIRVPDNARFWGHYLTEYEAMKQRPRAEWTTDHTHWIARFFREIATGGRWGSSGHYHKWMYDDISLILTLENAGFRDVQRMPFLQSRIQDVNVVEVRDELIVEGVKPG